MLGAVDHPDLWPGQGDYTPSTWRVQGLTKQEVSRAAPGSRNLSQKSAKDICESMGGRYESNIQYCNDVAE
jgi:hypothetical protein